MLDTIESAIEDIKRGKMIIVVDDENRENEGDLLMAAELVTPEAVNFMARYGRGLICAPLSEDFARRLNLNPMVERNEDSFTTAFTVSVDATNYTTTGISVKERAMTLKVLSDPYATPTDFRRPGHIFPLIAKDGGVNERPGHTEAATDFATLAGLTPVGVICEILNEDGSCARLPELRVMANEHDLKLVSIEDLITYKNDNLPKQEVSNEDFRGKSNLK